MVDVEIDVFGVSVGAYALLPIHFRIAGFRTSLTRAVEEEGRLCLIMQQKTPYRLEHSFSAQRYDLDPASKELYHTVSVASSCVKSCSFLISSLFPENRMFEFWCRKYQCPSCRSAPRVMRGGGGVSPSVSHGLTVSVSTRTVTTAGTILLLSIQLLLLSFVNTTTAAIVDCLDSSTTNHVHRYTGVFD